MSAIYKKYRIWESDYRRTTGTQRLGLTQVGLRRTNRQQVRAFCMMSDESRSDRGMKDADITSALGVGQSTVERHTQRAVWRRGSSLR